MSDVFINLSDAEIDEYYRAFRKEGLTTDEIFDRLYNLDCMLDD